ncbi:DUF3160 domain-containing protein [Prevotella sp. tf2-5]|uniref:DUF3160 domain-containing protein n=1 Tax=Prevotella sp. tf2-5 TaxID=1761889 RepID=UPI0008E91E10|nr:DUF3160 domain-containing protein [Prevotella sp. tf2-5]SFO69906.1 YARHG domain-containing protein [Prevotella sp. tf2-5]
MKKILLTMMMIAFTWEVSAQESHPVIIPGKGHIDVEQLNKKLPLNINVDNLSIAEIRILRNAVSARQGYCFMNGDLRGIFGATSWYTQKMEDRFWKEENGKAAPIKYTAAEQAFVQKLKKREDFLKTKNNVAPSGMMVNMENIINSFQLESFDQRLYNAIGKNGFAIVPGEEDQLFHIYERNDYRQFPSFVTTDLYLQAFHMFFDCLLKETEEQKFSPMVTLFVKQNYEQMMQLASTTTDAKIKAAAEHNAAYYAIAYELNTGKSLPVPASFSELVKEEINHVNASETTSSEFLGYTEARNMPMFIYNIYRPRGHYTRNETLKRYFCAMMWLQNAPFGTDKDDQLEQALLLAQTIGGNAQLTKQYKDITEPITYLMGMPDDVSILQVYAEIQKSGSTVSELINDKKKFDAIRKALEELSKKQSIIKPKFQASSPFKICLMPQRYMPDSEVLQEMVDYESTPTLRDVPKGLDILASIGISSAERILIQELKEQEKWNKYTSNLEQMKKRMGEIDWNQTVANKWIASLKDVNSKNAQYPKFMLSPQWDKKNLNTALASWAELKHDAILYAKQPMGAECGGGGPPEPYVKGYVEPNIAYWTKAIELIDATMDVLRRFDLVTEKGTTAATDLREQAEFLLNCSKKELAGKNLTEQEYRQIETIGSTFENITLNLIKESDQFLMGWSNVNGADKKISVVADVYTANSYNNPDKSVLYEAVGPAHEIYVVVELDGYLYLTRGAVFSYREFQEDIAAPRKTDEEWQQELQTQPDKGIPNWMKEIIVPLGGKSLDNEHIFYSSGC